MASVELTVAERQQGAPIPFENAEQDGNHFTNDGNVLFWVWNTSPTATLAVTMKEEASCDHVHHGLIDLVLFVPPGGAEALGPFDIVYHNDVSNFTHATYSYHANVGVAAVRYV